MPVTDIEEPDGNGDLTDVPDWHHANAGKFAHSRVWPLTALKRPGPSGVTGQWLKQPWVWTLDTADTWTPRCWS